MNLANLRREYSDRGIGVTDLTADPIEQFARWFAELDKAVPKSDTSWFEPNAMVLSTADAEGRPCARTVLLKRFGPDGFAFYTNYRSRKGRQLAANPAACLLFPWYPLERQVIVTGEIRKLPDAESDAYFATRPRGAQLGAWASEQSEVIADRALLDERYTRFEREFPETVPRPPHWGGLLLEPQAVEFWQGRSSRLHDRLRYVREAQAWRLERLSP
ncbi:pyridoxamine 5'-phosphate oxidase [Actinocrinis puniceicyclus]|uniref:pyridoxamine 5'-phosphate oxidase n=1 Tax=Actinocrinis puniceicyclus TaxID=977794 RepID=UPI0028ABE655|nr:pyridoxamine 5'-phosphate oxidase [Actinocrinis puniceicyclus]